jgi:predicted transcriptional regulator
MGTVEKAPPFPYLADKIVEKKVSHSPATFMAATTVRISPKGHTLLRRLASASDTSMAEVLEAALETYRRQKFLEEAAAAYDELRRDPRAWKKHQADLAEWETTLGDGLKDG